jgi:hypothetical protein
MRVAIDRIRTDGGTQTRAELNLEHVNELADALRSGTALPAVIVFYDGTDHWLADGFHRHAAAIAAVLGDIDADVRQGTRRDAVLFSVGANASHGLKRSNADKRRAVETLLRDPEWCQWSDRVVAKACGVVHEFVRRIRKERSAATEAGLAKQESAGGYVATCEQEFTGSKISNVTPECTVGPRKGGDGKLYPAKRQPRVEPTPDSPEYWAGTKGPPVPPISVPDPVIPPEPKPRPWAPEELNALVRDTLNACHDQHEILDALEKRVAENFAKVEPRFAIDLIQRCECAIAGLARRLANTAETISAHLPSDEPTRRFGVIKGGRT